jgi:hypothetical protein
MKRVVIVEHDRLHRELIREWLEQGSPAATANDAMARRLGVT